MSELENRVALLEQRVDALEAKQNAPAAPNDEAMLDDLMRAAIKNHHNRLDRTNSGVHTLERGDNDVG